MLSEICNYRQINARIGTSGLPTEAQIGEIGAAGYEVIINLLPYSEQHLPDEDVVVEEAGMEYGSIPVVWTSPQVSEAVRFFDEMDARQQQKVWVHCAANLRVSAFLYLWRTLRRGEPEDVARADLDAIWKPNQIWQALLRDVEVASSRSSGTHFVQSAVQ